jgi:hypothetical protein
MLMTVQVFVWGSYIPPGVVPDAHAIADLPVHTSIVPVRLVGEFVVDVGVQLLLTGS